MNGHYVAAIDLAKYFWKNGGPFDIWLTSNRAVGEVIREHDVHPVAPEDLFWDAAVPMAEMDQVRGATGKSQDQTALRLKPRPFPGGIRAAHLHYKGEVYMLTNKQWNDFSNRMVGELRERLSNARDIGFQQLTQLAEAMGPIG